MSVLSEVAGVSGPPCGRDSELLWFLLLGAKRRYATAVDVFWWALVGAVRERFGSVEEAWLLGAGTLEVGP